MATKWKQKEDAEGAKKESGSTAIEWSNDEEGTAGAQMHDTRKLLFWLSFCRDVAGVCWLRKSVRPPGFVQSWSNSDWTAPPCGEIPEA